MPSARPGMTTRNRRSHVYPHRQRPRRAASGMAAQHHRRCGYPDRRLAGLLSTRHPVRDGAARRGRLLHACQLSTCPHRARAGFGAGQFDHHQRCDDRARARARAADGLGRCAHQYARAADRARVGAGRLRDPELHFGDRLDLAARTQCRPDQRVRARDLRHRAAVQYLQHGRSGAGADLELLPAHLLRGHRGARQHGPILRGGGADGRCAGLARVHGHRVAAGAAGDRRIVGVRVPRSHGRIRRAGRDRARRPLPYADHQDLRAVLLSAALRAGGGRGGADHRLHHSRADSPALGSGRPPLQRDRRQVEPPRAPSTSAGGAGSSSPIAWPSSSPA